MITTIVQFALPLPMTVEEAKIVFLSTAGKYQRLSDNGLAAGEPLHIWYLR